MLIIRDAQLAALRNVRARSFLEQLIPQLAADFPSAAARIGDAGLRTAAQTALEVAERHGLDSQGSVAALASLLVQYGPRLERCTAGEWAWRTLADRRLPEVVRIDAIVERLAGPALGRVVIEQDED